ncbi:MAG TPA: biotin transporter BioY [Granulicella sp.]
MHSTLSGHLDRTLPASSFANSRTGRIVFAIAATGLMAVASHVAVPLPFSPVPLTLAPFMAVLIGLTLGPLTAFSALVLYLAEGASGLPVFTPQGPGGIAQLLSPTGGYLFAYPLAAAVAGWLARSLPAASSTLRGLVASTAGTAVILSMGALWLSSVLHLHAAATWSLAVAPFLPGEAVKVVAAAMLYSAMCRWQQS